MNKTLKTIAIVLFLATQVIPTEAQEYSYTTQNKENSKYHLPDYDNKTFHFGFLLAFNEMTYALRTVKDYQNIAMPVDDDFLYSIHSSIPVSNLQCLYVQNIEPIPTPGFAIGITSNLRLGRHFYLRFIPTISFGERRMHYTIGIKDLEGEITTKDFTKSIGTTFVEFPINLKYSFLRYKNISPYFMGGINPRFDLASQKRNLEYNWMGFLFVNNFVTKRFDCAAEFGIGIDFYTKWLKLGVEVKMSEGILDIVKGDALIYTASIDQLRNRVYQISLLIE